MESEVLTPTRELRGGIYYNVHVTKDGRVRVNMGPDDQRPDHDGHQFFRPILVEQQMVGGGLYSYVQYCGSCRKHMGGLADVKEFCSRCGKGVAHYVFSMGTEIFQPRDWDDRLPDVWPVATIHPLPSRALPSPRKGLTA